MKSPTSLPSPSPLALRMIRSGKTFIENRIVEVSLTRIDPSHLLSVDVEKGDVRHITLRKFGAIVGMAESKRILPELLELSAKRPIALIHVAKFPPRRFRVWKGRQDDVRNGRQGSSTLRRPVAVRINILLWNPRIGGIGAFVIDKQHGVVERFGDGFLVRDNIGLELCESSKVQADVDSNEVHASQTTHCVDEEPPHYRMNQVVAGLDVLPGIHETVWQSPDFGSEKAGKIVRKGNAVGQRKPIVHDSRVYKKRSVETKAAPDASTKRHTRTAQGTLPFGSVAQALLLVFKSPKAQVGRLSGSR